MDAWLAYWPDVVVGFVFLAGLLMLVADDWRWLLWYLAVVYAGAAALISLVWPWTLAATLLVGGWMAASVLGLSQQRVVTDNGGGRLSERVLRLLAGVLAALLALAIAPGMALWLPKMGESYLWGSLALMVLGLWQVGLRSNRPLWVVAGLLTILAGFSMLYAVLEQALLLAGLMALVVVMLALAGGYLVLQQESEIQDEEMAL